MTEAQFGPYSQELIQTIAALAMKVVPDVDEVSAIYRSVGVTSVLGFYLAPNTKHLSIPRMDEKIEVMRTFGKLRRALHTPEGGCFYIATITATRDGKVTSDFDYDTEPDFDFPIDPRSYVADLNSFPRDPSTFPAWLVEAVELSK